MPLFSKGQCGLFRAQNNGQSTDNVWPEWGLDLLKPSLASHVDWSCTLSLLKKMTKFPQL